MCTSIIEIVRAEGMAKRRDERFPLSQTVVAYDHARHAPLAWATSSRSTSPTRTSTPVRGRGSS
jgi:hypothetical protein